MFFIKNERAKDNRNSPCLTLNAIPNVVPLPGILYKLTFKKEVGQNIIRNLQKLENPKKGFVLTTVNGNDGNKASENKKILDSSTEYDSLNKGISLRLTLIPSNHGDPCVGCLAKIVGFLSEEPEAMTFSLKTERRAIVSEPLINSGSQIFQSPIEIIDDRAKIVMGKQLRRGPQEFRVLFDSINNAIETFKLQYKEYSRSRKASEHLFLLSPLSNILFFQFNQINFSRTWSIILSRITDLVENNFEKKKGPEVYLEVLALLDLTTAVLPTSASQKLAVLAAADLTERFKNFENILLNFRNIFEVLDVSTDYVQKYFSGASNLNKSKLIASQLKSLRVFINDIKSQNTLVAKVEKPRDGGEEEDEMNALKRFIEHLPQCGVHPEAIRMLQKDFKRLAKMSPHNIEHQVLKNYFDIITDTPFGKYGAKESIDLEKARATLEIDHYGLKMVKRRLLEYICTLKLQAKVGNTKKKAPILLLLGPPGVGKTSIAKSAAYVLHRKFQRISLGGIHHESEIRGHRRTYVGAMCGLIVNALRKSGCMDPLILLDEVDKIFSTTGSGSGYATKSNGDPGAALLEVLDPEQNNTFVDHYIGFPVDLSQVLFFCTANDLHGISRPLLDRMEIIEISGYTVEEKIQIGTKFLLPKQTSINGLDKCNCAFKISDKAWESLVLEYTREAGVRSLERQLAAIVRGKIREVVETEKYKQNGSFPTNTVEVLQQKDLLKYLGFPLYPITVEILKEINRGGKEGIVNGLSYSSDGTGGVLVFEVVRTGSSKDAKMYNGPTVISTGNLGRVLRESIDIAKSLVKSILRRKQLTIFREFLSSEYHLHVPAGAISKDGPSAGAAIALSLLSAALKKPVSPTLCMTGEITVRGKILPIGGVKGKLLGARVYGMRKVLIPLANRSELVEIITDDVSPFANKGNRKELDLIRQKMNLQVCYIDTIYDVINEAWPDLASASSSSPTDSWASQDSDSLRPRL